MEKRYACSRFPGLSLGPDAAVHFRGGFYTATTPEECVLIQSNDWYGVHIVACDGKDYAQDSIPPELPTDEEEPTATKKKKWGK